MTNAEIIYKESVRLVEAGVLKTITVEGEEIPEPIHTFQKWKSLGYTVKKGEKSSIKFPVWKYKTKTVTVDNEEVETGNAYLRTAFFFTAAQVQKIG